MAGVEGLDDTIAKQMGLLGGLLAATADSTSQAIFLNLQQQWCSYNVIRPADSNIQTAGGLNTAACNVVTTHTLHHSTPFKMVVSAFKITAQINVQAANTNFATINLVYNNGNGGSDTVICSGNTTNNGGMGAMVAGQPLSVGTITAANSVIPAGSCFQIKVTKTGTNGLEMPQVSFSVQAAPSA